MNNFSKTITTFTICKFLEEAINNKNILNLLEKFGEECESIGGNREYFSELAYRELKACRLISEQEGAVAAPIANSVGAGGIEGMKPEDIGVPVSAQKQHIKRNSIFKRKKPNKYYNDEQSQF